MSAKLFLQRLPKPKVSNYFYFLNAKNNHHSARSRCLTPVKQFVNSNPRRDLNALDALKPPRRLPQIAVSHIQVD
jgi:hypothetical protein